MTIITTGVKGGNLVARQEIRIMMQDQDLMNLYILAVDRLQKVDQKDTLSWFQIAGIHGRPYIPYDGAGSGTNFGGYCTHSSILFPPWHRPYLALFEQVLAKHVTDIANEFTGPDKQKYVAAAQRFRIPYWDWAANADLPDLISSQKQVTLNTPTGSRTLNNPLYSYTFNPVYSDFGDGLPDEKVWESWKTTLRYPTATNATGKSNEVALEKNLSNNRYTLRDRTYNLLVQANTYEAFSNDGSMGTNQSVTAYDSLESVHGQIHGMTGRNGHMGVVDFAAFDPVFWMHHCNCDRIFALWQALNPQSYVVPKVNEAGTFATKRGTIETVDSPLAPFWQAPGKFWTAAGVRDTRTLNYTYPELAKWSTLSPQEKSARLRTDINVMYGKNAAFAALSAELFNVAPSVPTVGRTSAAVMNMPAIGLAPGAVPPPRPTVTSPGPAQPMPAGVGQPAQQPIKAPAKAPLDAATIRKNMEAGMQAARDKAAASAAAGSSGAAGASSKATAAVPASVAKPAASAAGAVASAAKAGAAAIPPLPAAVHDQLPASLSAVLPGQPSQASGSKGRESFEIAIDNDDDSNKKHYNEWLANISVEKYAAQTSFFVYIFLGDFNTDPSKWGEDPNLVGTHFVFANNMNFTGCERCRDAAEKHKLVTGTIPLTGALGDRLGKDKVGALAPAEIAPYLKKELHWRILTHDDKVVEREQMPSLKISVVHVSVALPDNIAEFPTWGNSTKDASVTTGRAGGATEND